MAHADTSKAIAVRGLSASERLVLIAVTHFANASRGNILWHSQSTLAAELEMNTKTVREALKSLETKGLIRRTPRTIDKGEKKARTTDVITVIVAAMDRPGLDERRPVDNSIGEGERPSPPGRDALALGARDPHGGGVTPEQNMEVQGNEPANNMRPAASDATSLPYPQAEHDDGWNNWESDSFDATRARAISPIYTAAGASYDWGAGA